MDIPRKEGEERCPMCKKATTGKYKPFCSSRCSLLDLGKWLGEGYRLETEENTEESAFLPDGGDDENRE
jgi:hypothetical protein